MISTAQLILELRSHLGGLDTTDLPDADATLLLNRAYWEVIDKFPFREKEVSQTFPTVMGVRFMGIPVPFEALRQLSIEDPNTFQHVVLNRMTPYDYENTFVNNPDMSQFGMPTNYVREDAGIRLWPTPDQVYSITIKYWTVLSDLVSGSSDPEPPQSWDEIILYGAVWRGFLKFGDFDRAAQMRNHVNALIASAVPTEAKEEFDTHKGGVQVPGYSSYDIYFRGRV